MDDTSEEAAVRELQHQADDAAANMSEGAARAKKAQAEFAGWQPNAAGDFTKATEDWMAAKKGMIWRERQSTAFAVDYVRT